MADFPSLPPVPLFINSYSFWSGNDTGRVTGVAYSGSLTWPAANDAFYVPLWIPWPYPLRRMMWINGTSVAGPPHMDAGIYTASGTLLFSTGSTAESGASAAQYVAVSPEILLSPGRYYFALSCDSVTANQGGAGSTASNVPRLQLGGVLRQASAHPLPATMTPVTLTASCYPFVGMTRTSSGF